MTEESKSNRFEPVPVDLKNPAWAAFLAWLWPGAGHIYQRRYGKAILFMSCILVTYFWGFAMGQGKVVYASFRENDVHYPYLLQVGVGLPALPALMQSFLADGGQPVLNGFMAPPPEPIDPENHDAKASWHWKLGLNFEMATLFTMVAGLLNVLAIFDAYAGPAFGLPEGQVSTDPNSPEAIQARRQNLSSNLTMIGVILGIVLALNYRTRVDVDGTKITYLFAIAGGVGGALLSRGLSTAISGFLHRLPDEQGTQPTAPASDSES